MKSASAPRRPDGAISADTMGPRAWGAGGRIETPDGENLSERYLIRWLHEETGRMGCLADDSGEAASNAECVALNADGQDHEVVVTHPGARYVAVGTAA
jgi:hypothetical protein